MWIPKVGNSSVWPKILRNLRVEFLSIYGLWLITTVKLNGYTQNTTTACGNVATGLLLRPHSQ